MRTFSLALLLLSLGFGAVAPFTPSTTHSRSATTTTTTTTSSSSFRIDSKSSLWAGAVAVDDLKKTEVAVEQLKKVLEREYISFFDPMERQYYSETVTFDDPLTSLAGVDSYQSNVDMLSSRTLMGKILFCDASIILHSVTGGEVSPTDGSISNIITRWTLRLTAKILPWKPTARFSGISVYEVAPTGPKGVEILHQTDYWDSINIQEGGSYAKADKSLALQDFLDQLKPDSGNAAAAAPEVPYELLRRGKGYEVRKYPSYTVAKISYERRDEGFDQLATVTQGMSPLAPAIMEVSNDESEKTMSWPLVFAAPGASNPPHLNDSFLKKWENRCTFETIPGGVVAVGSFSDASVGPIVRRADRELREALKRDGISVPSGSETSVKFAQYDAIFTLGKRRGEVWIPLEEGSHPW